MTKFELHYPVRPWRSFQGFGECHPSVCHIYKGQLGLDGHNGIDAQAYHGQNVYAAHDGIVTFAGEDGSAGWGVVIRTHDKLPYEGKTAYFKSIYWHLKIGGIKVVAGQHVKAGDLIALADNTGMSTGDHLHFGIKPVYQGEKSWEWMNVKQNNGYKGAINPAPYFSGKYADEIRPLLASDYIAIEAAKNLALGKTVQANALFVVAKLLKSIGQ